MATFVVTAAKIFANSVDLTSFSNQVSVTLAPEIREATTFGSGGTREYLPGLVASNLAFNGYASSAEPDATLHDELGVKSPFTVATTGTVGDLAYLTQGVTTTYGRPMQIGEMAGAQIVSQGTGPLARGWLLENGGTARTSSGNGGSGTSNPGTSTSGDTIYGALHVLSASVSDTLDVTVQSDSSGAFSSPTTRLTFSQANSISSQWATNAAGASTDTFWRVAWTIAGSAPSFTFAVSFGFNAT